MFLPFVFLDLLAAASAGQIILKTGDLSEDPLTFGTFRGITVDTR